MRLIKIIGLAAIAALAAMAVLGAASASAETLCKVNTVDSGTCPAGSAYALPQHIEGLTSAGNPAILLGENSEGKVTVEEECHSTALGTATTNDGPHTQLLGLLTTLTFTNCSGICSGAESKNTPYLVEALALSLLVHFKNHGFGAPAAWLTGCFGFVTCKYEATGGSALLDFTGGNPAHLTALKVPLKLLGGFGCPAKGSWDALYEVLLPKPVWLTALP